MSVNIVLYYFKCLLVIKSIATFVIHNSIVSLPAMRCVLQVFLCYLPALWKLRIVFSKPSFAVIGSLLMPKACLILLFDTT